MDTRISDLPYQPGPINPSTTKIEIAYPDPSSDTGYTSVFSYIDDILSMIPSPSIGSGEIAYGSLIDGSLTSSSNFKINGSGNVAIGANPNSEKLYIYTNANTFTQLGGAYPVIQFNASNYLKINDSNTQNTLIGAGGAIGLISNGYSFNVSASGVRNMHTHIASDALFKSIRDTNVNKFTINHSGFFGDNRLGVNVDPTATSHFKGKSKISTEYVGKFEDSDSVTILNLRNDGFVVQRANNFAIADADLSNSQFSAYIDESSDELIFKVKYSTGVVKTASVMLL